MEDAIAWFEQWKRIVLSPREYFSNMPVTGGLNDPIKFYVIMAIINALFFTLINLPKGILGALLNGIGALILIPAWSFAHAGIVMLLSRAMGGTGNYEATYRACAYSAAPGILGWLPFINCFSGLYALFLQKLALERAQELPSQRAIAVVAIQVGVFIILMVVIGFMMAAMVITAHKMGGG